MNLKKGLIIGLTTLAVAALAGTGIWFWQNNRKDNVVPVYPMDALNMRDYVDTGSELTGTIVSDYVQEVVADGSKDIKKVYVKKGQQVKKGDKLLKYNVDEQELDVRLQQLQIQSAQLQIENMEKELTKLRNTRPVGAIDGSRGAAMQASVSLQGLKGEAIASLLSGTGQGTLLAAGGDTGSQSQDAGSQTDSGSNTDSGQTDNPGSSEAGTGSSEQTSENSGAATDSTDSTETQAQQPTEEELKKARETAKDTIKDAMSGTYDDEYGDTDKEIEENLYSEYSKKIDNAKTLEEITALRKEATALMKLTPKRDAAKKELITYVVDKKYGIADTEKKKSILDDAENKINAADSEAEITEAKEEALNQLGLLHGGPLYTLIDDENEQQASNSGSGSNAQNPIRFLLVKDGTSDPQFTGDVVDKLFNNSQFAGKYIEIRVYSAEKDYPKGSPAAILQLTPDTELKGTVNKNKNYTVSEIEKLIKQKTTPSPTEYLLKSLTKYTQHQSGRGTLKSKYRYNLRKNALITGSVINNLISKKRYAIIRDYESDDAYAAGDSPLNVITITPDTTFSEKISGMAKYTVRDLNKLLVSVKSVTVAPRKKGLSTVKTGKKYRFIATVSGTNVRANMVKWSVSNAKSDKTSISGGGVLTVGSDERAAALKVTAAAGTKKGSYLVNVKKTGNGSSKSSSDSDDDDDDDDDSNIIDDDDDDSGDSDTDVYTAEELKEAIAEKEQEIAEAKADLTEAKINYREAKKEVDDAIVKAKISGRVTLAYTAEDAPTDSPVVTVRADDGMYVKTAVSELVLDTVKVGGTLTCTSYETNEEYVAEVKEVADYPTEENTYTDSSGNPNSSYYQVMAYIPDAEGLKIGDTVTIKYDSLSMGTASDDTVYLPMAYVRTEGKKSYVYKADKDGRLKKSYIKTGSSVSGQFVEVTAGVTLDDKLAFPYGKNVKDGARTKVSEDLDDIVW